LDVEARKVFFNYHTFKKEKIRICGLILAELSFTLEKERQQRGAKTSSGKDNERRLSE